MNFKFYVLILSLFLFQPASAQLPVLKWAKAFMSNNAHNATHYNNARTIDVDAQGNVYSAGLFEYAIDFDPGPGQYTLEGGSPQEYGIYISKLDASGNFVWAVQVPTLVEFGSIELKVDKDGNVYLVSVLSNVADMDPGPGVQLMTPIGAKDAFVIKLDTNGTLVWAKQFGGPGDTVPSGSVLDIDKDGNVIICGLFNSTVDFDPGPGVFNLTSTAHIQSFIVKLSSAGTLIWAKQFGNAPVVYSGSDIFDVKCDAYGNICLIGGFAGTCDFDPGTGTYPLTGKSMRDGFIAKLTTNGDFVWAKSVSNTSSYYNYLMQPTGIDIDNMNNIVTTGYYSGSYDFDPGAAVYNVTSLGYYDGFVLKLNEQGDFIWMKTIGGKDSDTGNDIVVDTDNNLYVVGDFPSSVDYDPGPGNYTIPSASGYTRALVKLNSGGGFIYAAPFLEIGSGGGLFRRMAIDPARNIYITGYIYGIVDFDPGPGVYPLESDSYMVPVVLKLGPCNNRTTADLFVSACDNYTLNHETFDKSGTFTQTIANKSGCDSVITLHLTITKKFTEQTKAICDGEFFISRGVNQTLPGTYIDTLHTFLGCDSVVTTHLSVHPKPLPNLGADQTLCMHTQLNVTPGSFDSYQWQDMSQADSFAIMAPGIYWVKVTNSFHCTATDTITVPAMAAGPANFLPETDSICTFGKLEVSSLYTYKTYTWSDGTTDRTLTATKSGKYWLSVTSAEGCSGIDSITIYPKQCVSGIFIPSAFTPNGDGKNDIFKPLIFSKVQQYRFTVYNRWGDVVFQTTDQKKGWDGKLSAVPHPNAVFVWTCYYQLDGEIPRADKGTVTLIQ